MAVQTVDELSYYPCLAELLALPGFQGSRVLCGGAGVEVPVTGVNLSDTPEYYKWLSPGELMVTTCYAIHEDQEAIAAFVPTLVARGMSGLCIKPTQYLGCVPQVMVDRAAESGFPLVLLPDEVRFADIIKAVSDELLRRQTALLNSILTINKMLTRTIVEGADLNEIADMVCELTGSSILILDCINDRRALSLTETGAEQFHGMEAERICSTIVAGAEVFPLEVGGYSFGFLYIYEPAHPMEKQDERILSQVLQTIPLEISRERTARENRDRLLDNFILHILSDKILDAERECARAEGLGLNLNESMVVIRARLRERPDGANQYAGIFQHTLLDSEIKSTLAGMGISMRKVYTGEEYLVILCSSMDERSFRAISERFPKAVERFNREYAALSITAGCGRPYTGIVGLRQSEREACVALRAVRQSPGMLLFGKLGLLRLLYAGEPEEESAAFVNEILGRLLDREQQKGQELLKTLDSYLRNFGNLKRVAEELFTHYNTVVYRLKSIQEATGLDPRDSDQRFLLELALNLYRYERRDGQGVLRL